MTKITLSAGGRFLSPKPTVLLAPHQSLLTTSTRLRYIPDGYKVDFVPEKETYSFGESFEVRFHVQNVSDHDIQIASEGIIEE